MKLITDKQQEIFLSPNLPEPTIEASASEIELGSGSLVRIIIHKQDGSRATFWVSAKLNGQNQPRLGVSTNRPLTRRPQKTIYTTGSWVKPKE